MENVPREGKGSLALKPHLTPATFLPGVQFLLLHKVK